MTETSVAGAEQEAALNRILQHLHNFDTLSEAMSSVEADMLYLLNAERITVYQKSKNDKEIISKYKSGTDIKEIRIPLSPASIAGYAALSQAPLVIKNAYDSGELQAIHPKLKFEQSFDRISGFLTSSVLAIPIKFQNVLLGVLQVLNRRGGGEFSEDEKAWAGRMAEILGQKFRYELNCTKGPYEYLLQTRRIKEEQLREFEKRAKKEGRPLSEILLLEGGVSRFELGASLEAYYQVPFVSYDDTVKVPRHLLKGINDNYLLKQLWVPIEADGQRVTVLIDDPSDAARIMEIQRTIPAKEYVFKVGLPDDIRRYLGQNLGSGAKENDIHELVGKLKDENTEQIPDTVEVVDENTATIIQLVNKLIHEAQQARASDIHVEPGKDRSDTVVRFRIDGICRPHLSLPASHSQAVVSRIKIMSGLDISERRKPQDGKCLLKFKGQPLELRVATLPTVNGEEVVMRLLTSSEPLPLDKMNFSPRNLEQIRKILEHPHGIFLVVGPTGSGKTTTLHSVLGHINTPEKKIWTAEDPVEITQPGLHQLQISPKIGLTFATALRAFLRADPDVIMIGEMRDQETAHAGVEASLTGHLVFSTLHTNSAPETVTRLLDLGIDPLSFSDALLGVLAQRLVRTLCSKCKEAYKATESEVEAIKRYYGDEHFPELGLEAGKTTLYRAKGCDVCSNSGYRGRTGIHELLVASDDICQLISKSAGVNELRDKATAEGTRTLMQDGIAKMVLGQTDFEQIKRVASV